MLNKFKEALEAGNTTRIMELALYIDVNERDENGDTALILAAANGCVDVVGALLTAGADVNAVNEEGTTALILAAANGCVDVVDALLTAGADANVVDEGSDTALAIAAENGHIEIVRNLLARGVVVSDKSYKSYDIVGPDATHEMVVHRCRKNRIIFSDQSYNTYALMNAAKMDHVEIMKMLFEAGADLEIRDEKGRTALHLAARRGSINAINFLLEVGADSTVVDGGGDTAIKMAMQKALDHEARHEDCTTIAKTLVASIKDISKVDYYRKELLLAAGGGQDEGGVYDEMIITLLKAGADVRAVDTWHGRTALLEILHHANASVDSVKALIAAGSDVNAKDKYGNPPLINIFECFDGEWDIEIINNFSIIINELLKAGADANATNKAGVPALMLIVELLRGEENIDFISAYSHIVNQLLTAGADLTAELGRELATQVYFIDSNENYATYQGTQKHIVLNDPDAEILNGLLDFLKSHPGEISAVRIINLNPARKSYLPDSLEVSKLGLENFIIGTLQETKTSYPEYYIATCMVQKIIKDNILFLKEHTFILSNFAFLRRCFSYKDEGLQAKFIKFLGSVPRLLTSVPGLLDELNADSRRVKEVAVIYNREASHTGQLPVTHILKFLIGDFPGEMLAKFMGSFAGLGAGKSKKVVDLAAEEGSYVPVSNTGEGKDSEDEEELSDSEDRDSEVESGVDESKEAVDLAMREVGYLPVSNTGEGKDSEDEEELSDSEDRDSEEEDEEVTAPLIPTGRAVSNPTLKRDRRSITPSSGTTTTAQQAPEASGGSSNLSFVDQLQQERAAKRSAPSNERS